MGPDVVAGFLREQAATQPDAVAFGFLTRGSPEAETVTYAELDGEARRIAVLLGDRLAPGARALLVYAPGLDFVKAFFGALYAGVAAVPVYPPAPPRVEAAVEHMHRVATDARAEALLTTAGIAALRDRLPGLAKIPVKWIATDDGAGSAGAWFDRGIHPDDVALLQYTSGSTSTPRGVVVRHRNLVANQIAISSAMGLGAHTVGVSWLPMYHDMGLIGFVITPIALGIPSYLMSPLDFLQEPACWLRAITRYRGDTSGGPNFGYELCAKRVRDEELDGLDLSSWQVAFSGSEAIRPDTMRRFAARFGEVGFDPAAQYACYGLAEATLLVTGGVRGGGVEARRFDAAEIGANRALDVDDGGVEITCAGRPPDGHEVVITDPAGATPLADDHVGEILVRGPSVADGYWGRPGDDAFAARVEGRDEPFLRTGDLGFLRGGALYVTGRIKELIVVRGRNIYPQDIEVAVQEADPRLRSGCGAAFAAGDGEVALVQETAVEDPAELDELLEAMQRATFDANEVTISWAVLARPRTVPKTSSGKVKRRACREELLAGQIEPLAERRATERAGIA